MDKISYPQPIFHRHDRAIDDTDCRVDPAGTPVFLDPAGKPLAHSHAYGGVHGHPVRSPDLHPDADKPA